MIIQDNMWPVTTLWGGSRKNWKVSYRLYLKDQFISFPMMYNTSLISEEKLWYGAVKNMKIDKLKFQVTEKTAIKVRPWTKKVLSTDRKVPWIDLSNGSVPLASTRQSSASCAKIFTFNFKHAHALFTFPLLSVWAIHGCSSMCSYHLALI